MSVGLNAQCMACHLSRSVETARALGDDAAATAFAKELLQLYLSAPEGASSPWLGPKTTALLQKYYHVDADRFRQEKIESNAFVLGRLDTIKARVQAAPDPVFAGLQFSILGNYIDFSALHGEVSFETLDEMLEKALQMELDRTCYADLCRELETAGKLLYLTDNAGEIVFDRIFAEELQKAYPNLSITFCVRGGPTNNDATREDAAAAGIPFPVIDNGNLIPGTEISLLSPEARRAMDEADVILAKGQGNVETLLGCGYNIYYAFLVKCVRFIDLFQKPKLTPMLVKERQ